MTSLSSVCDLLSLLRGGTENQPLTNTKERKRELFSLKDFQYRVLPYNGRRVKEEKSYIKLRVGRRRGWESQAERRGRPMPLGEPGEGIKTFIMSYFSWGGCRVRAEKS